MDLEIETSPSGAELTSIKYNKNELLHQGKSVLDENGDIYWRRQAPILFPIVGSLKDNTAKIDGKNYHMSQHGFARDMVFDIVKLSEREHEYVLKYNEDTLKQYPFKFELYVSYLVYGNELTVKYRVKNVDNKPMYFGIGGHPAFKIDLKGNDYKVEFEKVEDEIKFYQLDSGLISYENTYINRSLLSNNCIKIKNDTFAHDAIIMSGLKSRKIRLIKNDINKMEFDFTGFKYLALWSKKNAPFLCIEPWYTTADYVDSNQVFEEKKDNIKLDSGNEFVCSYKIAFY